MDKELGGVYSFLLQNFEKVKEWLWDYVGSYVVNLVIVILIEIFYHFDGFIAILYTIYDTIGIKVAILLLVLYTIDKIMIMSEGERQARPSSEKGKRIIPVAEVQEYRIRLVDRALAFLAICWPLTQIFMFHLELVYNYDFLIYLDEEFLRGLVFFLTFTPFNNALLTVFIFRELIRRRGPDTKWYGGQYQKVWIKHFVRYHWCYAMCLNTLTHIFMFAYFKFAIAGGMDSYDQEVVSTVFFFTVFTFCCYGGICAILGLQPRFPLFHGACIIHVGRLKKSGEK